jgi:hypothetical protein
MELNLAEGAFFAGRPGKTQSVFSKRGRRIKERFSEVEGFYNYRKSRRKSHPRFERAEERARAAPMGA